MNVQEFRRRLLDTETRLAARIDAAHGAARAQVRDAPGDAADASVADEAESEAFADAEFDADVLRQVRDALRRIDDGTFGQCIVDGAPIEEKRLEAVPWARYCLEHQQLFEAGERPRPTL